MAIVISKIPNTTTVKIVKDDALPMYYIQTSCLIQIPNTLDIQITFYNGDSLTLPYENIGAINGAVKPNTIGETADLLATDVFNTITTP